MQERGRERKACKGAEVEEGMQGRQREAHKPAGGKGKHTSQQQKEAHKSTKQDTHTHTIDESTAE